MKIQNIPNDIPNDKLNATLAPNAVIPKAKLS